ncbi:MAG TPA: alpha/beta hydrolase, partial [Nocardioidaceae bacterium]
MKARQPDSSGYAVNDGVRVYYEVHGTGSTTVVLLPTWAIVDSQVWKMQVPYLSRYFRVLTYDPRGNGKTDRPQDPAAYTYELASEDVEAVMDATDTEQAVLVAYCDGTAPAVLFSGRRPERVSGLAVFAPNTPAVAVVPERRRRNYDFESVVDEPVGWAKETRAYWQQNWAGYLDWFFANVASEPHSTKVYDDLVDWGLQTDA